MTENITVISAKELDEATKKRVEQSFSKRHNGDVAFSYTIDSSLIGGLLIIDGNDYYDSSIAGKLAKVKRNLQ